MSNSICSGPTSVARAMGRQPEWLATRHRVYGKDLPSKASAGSEKKSMESPCAPGLRRKPSPLILNACHDRQATPRQRLTVIPHTLEPNAADAGFREPDSERLAWPQRRQELHHRHSDHLARRSPRLERLRHFLQNHHARHNRITGKMPRQTGMVGGDHLALGGVRPWLGWSDAARRFRTHGQAGRRGGQRRSGPAGRRASPCRSRCAAARPL